MRTLNAKNPGRPYAPRFLDDKNLKAAVEEELYDISKVLEQGRQEFNYISEATYEKLGSWDPLTNKYPENKGRNAQWDVVLSTGESHVFDGKNWENHQGLLYLRSTNEYLQVIDPSKVKMIQQINSISVGVDTAKASIVHLEQAIATTDLALAETEDRLQTQISNVSTNVGGQQVDIEKLKSDLIITNTSLTTTNQTMAQNKTELNSRIDGVQTSVDNVKTTVDGIQVVVGSNTTSIGSLNSSLNVTNQTLSNLQSTTATNYTALDSKIEGVKIVLEDVQSEVDGVKTTVGNHTTSIGSLDSSLSITNQTVSTLQNTMSTNYTTLNSRVDNVLISVSDVQTTVNGIQTTVGNHTTSIGSLNSNLAVTNQTVSGLQNTMSTNYTTLNSKIDDVKITVDGHTTSIGSLNSSLSVTNQTLSNLQSTTSTNNTTLNSRIDGVQSTVSGVQSSVTGVQTDIDGIQTDVNGIQTNINGINNSIGGINNTLGNHGTLISNLSSDLSVTNQTVTNLSNTTASNKTELQSQINTLNTSTGNNTNNIASLSSQMTTYAGRTDGLYARWVLKTDVNGKISGIDLLNNGSTSTFDVVADSFKVYNGTTSVAPFEIVGGNTKIKNAIIGDVQSDDWNETTKSSGWKIYKDGTAFFNSATITGDVVARSFKGVVLNTLFTNSLGLSTTTEGVFKQVLTVVLPLDSIRGLPSTTEVTISGVAPILCNGNGYYMSRVSLSSTPPTYEGMNAYLKVKSGTGSTHLLPYRATFYLYEILAHNTSSLKIYAALGTVADMGFGGGNFSSEIDGSTNLYPATISLRAPS